jgi:hypothetical protein
MPELSNGSASEELLAHIFGVMRENEAFLHNNAEEACDAVIGLVNGAIDQAGLSAEQAKNSERPAELAIAFFVHHALMPFSYAIYIDLVAGNLPACFMQLRLILETMAECYLADAKYEGTPFFYDRIKSLDRENLRPWRIISKAGRSIGHEEKYRSLWGKLSTDWLHPKGIADRVINHLAGTSEMPTWSLTIPMNYKNEDLAGIDHLGRRISQFRDLLAITMGMYWSKNDRI